MNDTLRGVLLCGAPLSEVRDVAVREDLLITIRQYAVYLIAA